MIITLNDLLFGLLKAPCKQWHINFPILKYKTKQNKHEFCAIFDDKLKIHSNSHHDNSTKFDKHKQWTSCLTEFIHKQNKNKNKQK